MEEEKKEIKEARMILRNLYKKYTDELHTVITKIDKLLEVMGK